MVVLGLSTFGENPAACLLIDGKLQAFSAEDRFNRIKNSPGQFPSTAASWCLKTNNLKLQDVDRLAVSWGCHKYPFKMLRHLTKVKVNLSSYKTMYPAARGKGEIWNTIKYLNDHSPKTFRLGIRDALRTSGCTGPIPQIEFVEHHLSHAYQTYYQSPFEEAAVLVADGSGEERCVSGYHADGNQVREVFRFDVPQSLGWFYAAFTAYLGFRPNSDEGKLMGLAALGQSRSADNPWIERVANILRVTNDGFELDPLYLKFGDNEIHPRFTDRLCHWVTSFDASMTPVALGEQARIGDALSPRYLLPNYIDLAFAVQNAL